MPRSNTNVYDRVPFCSTGGGSADTHLILSEKPILAHSAVTYWWLTRTTAQQPILVLRELHEQLGEEPFEYEINKV